MCNLLSWVVDWSSIAENSTWSVAAEACLCSGNTGIPKIAIEIKPHSQDPTLFGMHFDEIKLTPHRRQSERMPKSLPLKLTVLQ
jgi:hypothetical protein